MNEIRLLDFWAFVFRRSDGAYSPVIPASLLLTGRNMAEIRNRITGIGPA